MTHFFCVLLIALSTVWSSMPYASLFAYAGYFALSGALTNWLAVYMLFERVPFFYGSGVVPLHFEEFKEGIKHLIMKEFFNQANVSMVLKSSSLVQSLEKNIDYNELFDGLVDTMMASNFGPMIQMVGGRDVIEPLREPMIIDLKEKVTKLISQVDNHPDKASAKWVAQVEAIVDERLSQLTPQRVKQIVEKMIRRHLSWLVVWGGVVGGLIGLGCGWAVL